MSLRAAALALFTLAAFGAQGQTGANGRLLFKQKNCALCHFYEARSIAPSVKNMKAGMKGDPAQAAAAISSAAGHAGELKSISTDEIRAIAEWLAATTYAEQEAAAAAKPKPGSPEAKALAKKEAAAKAKQEAEAKALARKDAATKAKQEAEAKAQARLDAEAQGKREAAAKQEQAELARREADARARKDSAALDAIKREGDERARREAEAQANAKRDAEALAAKKREADERVAKQELEAKARREADALALQKREAEAQAQAKKPEAAVKAEPAAKEETAKPGARKKIAYRDGSDLPPCAAPTGAPLGAIDEAGAKAVIDRVGCPQCHAYVQKKTGPPMKQIHEKYKGDWECVVARLTKNKTHKEEGVTDDMKGNEFKIVADYIATRAK